MEPLRDSDSNCTSLPKIEAIINKLENMTFSHQYEWNRLALEEVNVSRYNVTI